MKILFAVFLLLNSLIGADESRVLGVYENPPSGFNPKIAVSACYAYYGEEYLLLQRSADGLWGVPGGKVETKNGESSFEAVLREFLEETGISLEADSIESYKTVYISDPEKDFIFHVYTYAFMKKPEISLSEKEHQAYAWRTIKEALKMYLIWGEKEVFGQYVGSHIHILQLLSCFQQYFMFQIPCADLS